MGWENRSGKGRGSDGGLVTLHGGTIGVFVLDMSDGINDERMPAASASKTHIIKHLTTFVNRYFGKLFSAGLNSLQVDTVVMLAFCHQSSDRHLKQPLPRAQLQ